MSALKIFTDFPLLALLPAMVFFVLARYTRRRTPYGAAVAWAGYAAYAFLVQQGVMCQDGCSGRLDLLFINPFLVVLSLVAVLSSLRGRKEVELE
jgi:hypothetical protein